MSKSATRGKTRRHGLFHCLCVLLLAGLLASCGPREIGQEMGHEPRHQEAGPTAAEQMRYPLMGANPTQFLLYQYNRPEVMEKVRNWHIERFSRMHGAQTTPDDPEYRARPLENSPFRQ